MKYDFCIETDRQYEIPARIIGKIEKEMVVCLHGFCGDKDSSYINEIAKNERLSYFCFDFVEHGASVATKSFSLKNCMNDLESVIAYLKDKGTEKFNFVATSFGAYVLVNFLLIHEDINVNKIVLRAPALDMENVFISLLKENNVDMEQYKRDGAIFGYGKKLFVQKDFLDELAKYQVKNNSSFKFKTLIIHGDCDKTVPCEDSKTFAALNENVKIFFVKGADHRFKKDGELELIVNKTNNFLLNG